MIYAKLWLNFQSLGVTPDLDHVLEPEFYRLGTKIELLMNRNHCRYPTLQGLLYRFLEAKSKDEKYACNTPYIDLCQDILKTEWEVLKRDLAAASAHAVKGKPALTSN